MWAEWSLGDAASCENCRADFDLTGEKPPCEECTRPTHLMKENETAWRLWHILAGFDRPTLAGPAGEMRLPIRSLDAITLCEKYNATLEDFESILAIETVAYPLLSAKWERERTQSERRGA